MVKYILECKSKRQFAVDAKLLRKSTVLAQMLEVVGQEEDADVELYDKEVLPLAEDVSERCMEKVIEWLEYHEKDEPDAVTASQGQELEGATAASGTEEFTFTEEISEWDEEFLQVDDATLFGLIMAANYLNIKGLLDLTTTYVARMIAEMKTPQEIRERFNLPDDLTKEDLEQIEKEAAKWLEDEPEPQQQATGGEQMEGVEPTPSTSAAAATGP